MKKYLIPFKFTKLPLLNIIACTNQSQRDEVLQSDQDFAKKSRFILKDYIIFIEDLDFYILSICV